MADDYDDLMDDIVNDEERPKSFNSKHDIPKEFFPFESEQPFEHCQICERNLLVDEVPYLIEKAVKTKTNDVIFEYAMCLDCAGDMRKQMSEDSIKAMEKYFEEHANFKERVLGLMASEELVDLNTMYDTCLITGKPINELDEYQLFAYCEGDKMIQNAFPYMVSAEAMEGVQELLSYETRQELDDFIDTHFGFPPEWRMALKGNKVFLV